ncbi:MAG TPA: NADH-quinone oxidoreductase subunit N [Thermoanaerobaculia bacterium]|nr:NADH-quinone oxidoreductase subunit N [Thermoanaerobaculia bacterium]
MIQPLLEPGWVNAILPEIVLVAGGLLLLMIEAFSARTSRGIAGPLAVIILIAATWAQNFSIGGTFFGGTYQISGITRVFDLTFLLAGILAALFAREYLEREGISSGEFYVLLLWATVGMMMMAKGLDLLIVILGLEILSICIFVLIGYHRRLPVANEASLKYFLMGAFATGFILYGTALLYGATQSTHIEGIRTYFATADGTNPLLAIAFVLLIAGFGFKLALAPFHPWAPDVYQGAPTPVAGWLSVAPKAATIIALARLLDAMTPVLQKTEWTMMLSTLAVLSMIVGNAVAIVQRDLKRMLAYSGIAHVGYMMIALLTVRDDSIAAVAVYAITYALMNIGAFGVVSLLVKNQNDPQTLDDIAGLGFRRPFFGLAMAICMFSLAGLPPTAGFIAKFYIFKTAIESGHLTVAFIGILTSIVSVYYYLRVVYFLYMKETPEGVPLPVSGVFATGALAISMIGIMLIGVFPTPLFTMATNAARELLRQ